MAANSKPLALVARLNAGLGDVTRWVYDPIDDPAGPSVLDYQPRGDDGVELGVAHLAAVGLQLRRDAARRTSLVDVATLADSESYGLDVNGSSFTRTSDSDATEPEVLGLMRQGIAGLSEPVWSYVDDTDGDGKSDTLYVEGLWSKFVPSSVANSTTYEVDVTWRDGRTTRTETVSYTSASSGATEETISEGLRDAFNSSSAPIRAVVADGNSDDTIDVVGAEPTESTNVTFSVVSNVTQQASHSTGNYSLSDNSTGANADLRVLPEATSVTFTVWLRHEDSGAWCRANNAVSLSVSANWTEIFSSLAAYDRIAIQIESTDGIVGAFAAPAIGES